MNWLDIRAAKVIATALVIAAALAFVWEARHTLMLFLFAIFFAYLVEPIVAYLARHMRNSRGRAILAVYLGLGLVLAVVGVSVGPKIVQETQKFAQTAPEMYEKIASGQIAIQVGERRGWSTQTRQRVQAFLASHQQWISDKAKEFGQRLASLGANIWLVLLVPVLAIFFLKDGGNFAEAILQLFERRRRRQFVEDVLMDTHVMLAHFLRAQLILAGLTMVAFTLVLGLARVPYGVVLGILAGILEFIPVVGPLAAALMIIGVAIATGYPHVLIIALFLGVWRVVQDYVTSPRIMGAQVELHPLAALFGILAGAEVAGVIGVYLSIPAMAALRIVWKRWKAYDRSTPAVPTLVVDEEAKQVR